LAFSFILSRKEIITHISGLVKISLKTTLLRTCRFGARLTVNSYQFTVIGCRTRSWKCASHEEKGNYNQSLLL